MKKIILLLNKISRSVIFSFRKCIHHRFSFVKECFSCLLTIESFFTVDQNVVIYVLNANHMIDL